MPGWRNGRRGGLKIRYLYGCAGSIPAPGTTKTNFYIPMAGSASARRQAGRLLPVTTGCVPPIHGCFFTGLFFLNRRLSRRGGQARRGFFILSRHHVGTRIRKLHGGTGLAQLKGHRAPVHSWAPGTSLNDKKGSGPPAARMTTNNETDLDRRCGMGDNPGD